MRPQLVQLPNLKDVQFNFNQLVEAFRYLNSVVQEYVNATSASVSRYLPDGNKVLNKEYYYVKTDSSANTVTIYPITGQYILGGASAVLTVKGDAVWLKYDQATQSWWYSSFFNLKTVNGNSLFGSGNIVAGGGGSPWVEVEIDFTTQTYSQTFNIVDAASVVASKILVLPSGKVATGRVGDDWAWDGITFAALPAVGSFDLTAIAFPGPVVGKRKIQYQIN